MANLRYASLQYISNSKTLFEILSEISVFENILWKIGILLLPLSNLLYINDTIIVFLYTSHNVK